MEQMEELEKPRRRRRRGGRRHRRGNSGRAAEIAPIKPERKAARRTDARIQHRMGYSAECAAKTAEYRQRLEQALLKKSAAVEAFLQNHPVCPRCSEAIQELSTALADRDSGAPVHFNCALRLLQQRETCSPSERIVYIGGGRFAVASFRVPDDSRVFSFRKIIEWEPRNKPAKWRQEIADVFCKTP
ncbi:hypothetical protein [Treponema endosymbiont of Eucomonympha sp.]|uniref:hypothetical protein n=1 Tax=Treponema endosymbiont of Eucomonympha sp. TaxID=1580831 RepID=UPI0007517351|nr:hypothetical protein [Treponema endosymbiont of Eucomonympha sp.]